MNCPFCGGKNTFGIGKHNGIVKWGCFRASCQIHGKQGSEQAPISGIKKKLAGLSDKPKSAYAEIPFLANLNKECIEYLQLVNSYEAYKQNLVEVRYAPKEHRVMFRVGKEGWIGRALDPEVKPKWKRYGLMTTLFSCGSGDIGVLVEDVPSACAVGINMRYTGLALLGTRLFDEYKPKIREYKEVIIALDPDALSKAFEIKDRLCGVNARIVAIPDDLKYYEPKQIKEILGSSSTQMYS